MGGQGRVGKYHIATMCTNERDPRAVEGESSCLECSQLS